MTVIARASGLRAHLRRAAQVLAATLAAVVLVVPASPAVADAQEEPAAPQLVLTPSGGGLVTPGEAAHARVTVTNDSADPVAAGVITLEAGRTPLRDAAALAGWLASDEVAGGLVTIATEESDAVAAGRSVTIDVFSEPLAERAPGVYPLRVRLGGTTPALEARSVIIVPGEAQPVAVVIPLTLTPASGGLASAEELAAATGPDGQLSAVLDAVAGSSVALAVDPAIPAAIRLLGAAAPASAQTWLTQLEALPNARFALQFADTDLTAQAQAGLPAPLEVRGFTSFGTGTAAGEEGAEEDAAAPGRTAAGIDAGSDAEQPAEPAETPVSPTAASDDVTAIRGALPGIVWPRGAVHPTDLAAFAAYLGGEVTTILPSSAIAAPSGVAADSDGHAVLVHESAASAALSRAIAESDAARRGAGIAEALGHLTLSAAPGPALLALERDETRTAAALTEALGAVAALSTPQDFEPLLGLSGPEITIATNGEQTRAAAVSQLLADEAALGAFSSILEDPAVLTELERIRILRVLAVGEPAGGFFAALETQRIRTRTTLGAVGIEPSSDVQILSASVDLPVWVRNDLPWPITVALGAEPRDARLEVQSETIVVSPAQTNTRARVPVQARVASGEVDVVLRLTSPTGVSIGTTEITRVIVRAEWENIGLIVLGTLVALLIGFGIVRTIRRKRRAAASDTSSEETP